MVEPAVLCRTFDRRDVGCLLYSADDTRVTARITAYLTELAALGVVEAPRTWSNFIDQRLDSSSQRPHSFGRLLEQMIHQAQRCLTADTREPRQLRRSSFYR
jgi:hypothetical protein